MTGTPSGIAKARESRDRQRLERVARRARLYRRAAEAARESWSPYLVGVLLAGTEGKPEPDAEMVEIARRCCAEAEARRGGPVEGPLQELNRLLGTRIRSVRQTTVWREDRGRPSGPNAWVITHGDGVESRP